jgi:hypothetical protein
MTDVGVAGCCLGASVMGKVGPRVSGLGRKEGCRQGKRGLGRIYAAEAETASWCT